MWYICSSQCSCKAPSSICYTGHHIGSMGSISLFDQRGGNTRHCLLLILPQDLGSPSCFSSEPQHKTRLLLISLRPVKPSLGPDLDTEMQPISDLRQVSAWGLDPLSWSLHPRTTLSESANLKMDPLPISSLSSSTSRFQSLLILPP